MEKIPTNAAIGPFDAAMDRAVAHLMAARAELEPLMVVLTEEERKHLLPVPAEIARVTDSVLQAASAMPNLPTLCVDYKPDLIADRADRAARLAPVINQIDALSRLVGDTRNAWLAEAYASLLALYRVAKVLADSDASFGPIARPLAELYAARRAPRAK